MEFQDKTLECKDCKNEFVFTSGEQEFYNEKGFQNEPVRCKPCRDERKSSNRRPKEMHDAVCAECGEDTQVPFKPVNDRPIYCFSCFQDQKN